VTSCRGIKVDVDRSSSFVGDDSSSVVETIGAKSRGACSTGGREDWAKSCAGGGVPNAPAAIEDVLTSFGVCGIPFEGEKSEAELGGGGILPTLAASDSCLLLTSASEVDGPEENLFLSVPRKPSFEGGFLSVDSEALVLTD
jgi:hypothetical protein